MLEPPTPRDHDADCLTNCPYISELFVETDTCAAEHPNHFCNCDEIAAYIAEREAAAFAEWEALAERQARAFRAWERRNG